MFIVNIKSKAKLKPKGKRKKTKNYVGTFQCGGT